MSMSNYEGGGGGGAAVHLILRCRNTFQKKVA